MSREFVRCEACGRMVARKNVRKGPEGQRLGPECFKKKGRAALDPSKR